MEAYLDLTDTLTLNRYLYCGANPLSYVDVMGFGYTDYVSPVTDTGAGWIRTAENWAVEKLAWKEDPNKTGWWYNNMYRFECGVRQGMVQWLGDTSVSLETMAIDATVMLYNPSYAISYSEKKIFDFANSMHYLGEAIETYTIPGLISMKCDEITESPDSVGRALGRIAPDIILAVIAKNMEMEAKANAGKKVYEGKKGTSWAELMSPEDATKYNHWVDLRETGLDQERINDIILTNKGYCPDPATYLSQEYIDAHLELFSDGAVKISATTPIG